MQKESSAEHYQCDLTALDPTQRKRRAQLATEVFPKSLEMREQATGYDFRFEFTPTLFTNIAELATLEHLCCPFFEITLEIEKNSNQLWLRLTGDPGVKQYIQAELGQEPPQ